MSKRSNNELLYGVLVFAIPACGTQAADVTASSAQTEETYVEVSFERACDDNNKVLVLKNWHDFKTIAVTIRWNAWKGETLTREVFAMPKTATEIGCAAAGEILKAAFTDF
jgi:hypothetical protein